MLKIERLMHHTGGILFNMAVKGWYFREQAELNVQWMNISVSGTNFTMVYWYILLYIVF